jgi:NTP pyrophosphatase (non-canonical NTP hydrolase)
VDKIVEAIKQERVCQDAKWGKQNHPPVVWLTILMEEVGEAAKAILSHDEGNYRTELIQVAAVAVAAIESLDRG